MITVNAMSFGFEHINRSLLKQWLRMPSQICSRVFLARLLAMRHQTLTHAQSFVTGCVISQIIITNININ